jgi:hypothetical protein
VLKFLPRIRQKKDIKATQIGNEQVKLCLLVDGMILYLKDHKDSTKRLLDLINTFSKVAG